MCSKLFWRGKLPGWPRARSPRSLSEVVRRSSRPFYKIYPGTLPYLLQRRFPYPSNTFLNLGRVWRDSRSHFHIKFHMWAYSGLTRSVSSSYQFRNVYCASHDGSSLRGFIRAWIRAPSRDRLLERCLLLDVSIDGLKNNFQAPTPPEV